jgi:hypothetical protein
MFHHVDRGRPTRLRALFVTARCLRAAAVDGTDEGDDGGVGDALFGGLLGDGFDEYGVADF